ncbi:MAG: hypothetical protein LBT16_10330 [Treponema sp.]|jgi:hypothetical protein|nr:hypothetical protein [Treponema sp.]
MDEKIFRKTSLDQVSSPDQLYDYIKVANPGVWTVLGAILLALAALVFWGISATIPTTVSAAALAEGEGRYVCYFSPALGEGISPGMSVKIGGKEGRVLERGEIPLSYREAARALPSDYAAYALGLGDWNIRVLIASGPAAEAGSLVSAVITVAQTRPLDFLFK